MRYKIKNKKTKVIYDKNLYFVKADGTIWRIDYPYPTKVSHQEDLEIIMEEESEKK